MVISAILQEFLLALFLDAHVVETEVQGTRGSLVGLGAMQPHLYRLIQLVCGSDGVLWEELTKSM